MKKFFNASVKFFRIGLISENHSWMAIKCLEVIRKSKELPYVDSMWQQLSTNINKSNKKRIQENSIWQHLGGEETRGRRTEREPKYWERTTSICSDENESSEDLIPKQEINTGLYSNESNSKIFLLANIIPNPLFSNEFLEDQAWEISLYIFFPFYTRGKYKKALLVSSISLWLCNK